MRARSILLPTFVVSLCALALEICLTRIFSVALWYHFAFVAVSVAMFGFAVGALALQSRRWRDRLLEDPVGSAHGCLSLFGASTVLAVVVAARLPFLPQLTFQGIAGGALFYVACSLPFVFAGLAVAIGLSSFRDEVGAVYASSLAGSAGGALIIVPLLYTFSAPVAALVLAATAAAVSTAYQLITRRFRPATAGILFVVAAIVVSATGISSISRIKGFPPGENRPHEEAYILERWNPFSRIAAFELKAGARPYWGLSRTYKGPVADRMMLNIDAAAATPVVKFSGDLEAVEFLRHDVTAIAHYASPSGKTLVIGSGGGRDVLAALLFGHTPVHAVEINPTIVELVRNEFAEYGGALYDREGVEAYVEDGRSFLARSRDWYGTIVVSMADSWAASNTGAFMLTENSLYTIEAVEEYLERLAPDGILSITRWLNLKDPAETLRLVVLASETLRARGVEDPERHILVAATWNPKLFGPNAVATMLVSPTGFTQDQQLKLKMLVERRDFMIAMAPWDVEWHPAFEGICDEGGWQETYVPMGYDLSPPTDDRPFFFNVGRPTLRPPALAEGSEYIGSFNVDATRVLLQLLVVVTVMALAAILLPGALSVARSSTGGTSAAAVGSYFSLLGLGFMLVEMGAIHRLTLVVGSPVAAMAVALGTLLLAGGLGSALSPRVATDCKKLLGVLGLVVVVSVAFALLFPPLQNAIWHLPLPLRSLIAALALAPLAFLMGIPFPSGLRLITGQRPATTAWAFAVNGSTSVVATVLGTALAVFTGFTTTLMWGAAAYAGALVVIGVLVRRPHPEPRQ